MDNNKQKLRFPREKFLELLCKAPETLYQIINEIYILKEEIEILKKENAELKARLNKDSHNSSKPPSSDGFKKKTKSLRKKSYKKSGGQKGHQGQTLKTNPNPDKIEHLKICNCPNCNNDLTNSVVISEEKRQVIDIPEIKTETIEYRAETKECYKCGMTVTAKFPEHISSRVQYGLNLRAFQIYFRNQNFIPTERAKEVFKDIFGVPLSEGTIYNTIGDFSSKLEPFELWIKEKILQSPVLHFDETGIRIEKVLHWIHSISNEYLTLYVPHEKRGDKAMQDINILPLYKGTVVHDYWKSYLNFKNCKHALCNTHHLRELTFLYEEEKHEWAKEMIELLMKIKEATEESPLGRVSKKEGIVFGKQFEDIIQKGFNETPPPSIEINTKRGRKKKGKALCLLERFRDKKEMILSFMYDPLIPFDNNQAERDIRMAKLYQKISGCFRTKKGAKDFLIIRSFLSTVKKHGLNVIESIIKILYNQNVIEIFG
jgi:transposase